MALTRKRIILAKLEVTEGVDPTPTGAANAILVSALEVKPMETDLVDRNLIRPYLGASERFVKDAYVRVTFEVEMAGSGTAGTAPAYAALLKACGMAEAVSAGISVTYTPLSATFPSLTIYANVDGVLHKVTGARGNVELSVVAGEIPKYKFNFIGTYAAPTDTAAPVPVYTAFKAPLVANTVNTPTFSLFAYAGVLQSLTIDFGNQAVRRTLIGATNNLLTDRKVTGVAVIEAPTILAKDYFGIGLAGTLGALSLIHGTAAGNKVQMSSATVSIANPDYADQDGVQMLSLPLTFIPSSAGNDEISIVVS